MKEGIFRVLAGLVFFTGIGISAYFRRLADTSTGESVPRSADGGVLMAIIRICGLVLWFTPIAYLVNPRWLAWSNLGTPDAVRWLGVGLGVLCVAGIYWLFSSIGTGITATSATRREHELSTRGPYRWIRHPLYTFGAVLFVSLGVIADSWLIAAARAPGLRRHGDPHAEGGSQPRREVRRRVRRVHEADGAVPAKTHQTVTVKGDRGHVP